MCLCPSVLLMSMAVQNVCFCCAFVHGILTIMPCYDFIPSPRSVLLNWDRVGCWILFGTRAGTPKLCDVLMLVTVTTDGRCVYLYSYSETEQYEEAVCICTATVKQSSMRKLCVFVQLQ